MRSMGVGLAALLALAPAAASAQERPVPIGLRCIQAAYPETICAVDATGATLCGGGRLIWDDGERKDSEAELDRPDLEDAMATPYPAARLTAPPQDDPGRARPVTLLKALYGDSPEAVRRHLRPVHWMPRSGGHTVQIAGVHGVAAALQAVSDELDRHPDPALRRKLAQTSGTFVWRKVRGTERLSAHSFAIAIDIAVPLSDFWRWRKPDAQGRYPYRNRIPHEVVEAFERRGFIWGGKWSHFDTMHFEYRPELLDPRCRAAQGVQSGSQASPTPSPSRSD